MVRVDVLFFEGCPNHEPTVELARSVVAELDLEAEVHEVPVESAEDAEARRFLGSPSVQGLYLDDQMSDYQVIGNTFIDCQVGMFIGGGTRNVVANNTMRHCDTAVHFDQRGHNC